MSQDIRLCKVYIPSSSKLQQAAHLFRMVYERFYREPHVYENENGQKFLLVPDAEQVAPWQQEADATVTSDIAPDAPTHATPPSTDGSEDSNPDN